MQRSEYAREYYRDGWQFCAFLVEWDTHKGGRKNQRTELATTNKWADKCRTSACFVQFITYGYVCRTWIQGIIRTGYNNIIHPCQVELKGIRSDRDSSTFWQWQIYEFVRTNYSFYLRRRRSSFAWLFVRKVPWSFASRDVHLQTFISTALGFIFGKQLKMCASWINKNWEKRLADNSSNKRIHRYMSERIC